MGFQASTKNTIAEIAVLLSEEIFIRKLELSMNTCIMPLRKTLINAIVLLVLSGQMYAQEHVFLKTGYESIPSSLSQSTQRAMKAWLHLDRPPIDVSFFFHRDTVIAWEDCGLDIWIYTEGAWDNLYTKNNFGVSCGAHFIRASNTQFYLVGGYGFWQGQGLYLGFDTNFKEWKYLGKRKDNHQAIYKPLMVFESQSSPGLFSLFGPHLNEKVGYFSMESNGYHMSDSLGWNPISFDGSHDIIDFPSVPQHFVNLKDYFVVYTGKGGYLGWLIADKRSNEIFFSRGYVPTEGFVGLAVYGNVLHLYLEDDVQITFDQNLIDKAEYIGSFHPESKIGLWYWLPVAAFMGIGLVGFFLVIRLKQRRAIPVVKDVVDGLYDQLINMKEFRFTVKELDQIFAIESSGSDESLRGRRASLINDLNRRHEVLTGNKLLVGYRDPKDRRYVIYVKGQS